MSILATERLILRPFTDADIDAYARVRAHDAVARYTSGPREGESTRDLAARVIGTFTQHWQTFGFGPWALVEAASGRLIGHHGLRFLEVFDAVEILYAIEPAAWGRGYATEAGRAARDYAFREAQLGAVMAIALPDNSRSLTVMSKIGMSRSGETTFNGRHVIRYDLDRLSWQDVYAGGTTYTAHVNQATAVESRSPDTSPCDPSGSGLSASRTPGT